MRVKISDFGYSAQLSSTLASKCSGRGGTTTYFSPEKGLEEKYGYAADMWAVGCILLELLIGEPLREALWQDSKEPKLRELLALAAYKSKILGEPAVILLKRDPAMRMTAFDLYSSLRKTVRYLFPSVDSAFPSSCSVKDIIFANICCCRICVL